MELSLFLMTAAFVVSKAARDALYFSVGGLHDLPLAYLGMAGLALPVALATLAAMRIVGAGRVRVLAPAACAVGLAALSVVVRPGGGLVMTAVFLAIPLAFGVLLSLAWLLTADLLAGAPAEALPTAYARVGAASLAGGVAGALLARLTSAMLAPSHFFLAAAAALMAVAVLLAWTERTYPSRCVPAAGAARGSAMPLAVFAHPRVRLIALMAMSAALAGVLIEFLFYAAASRRAGGGASAIAIFADLYLGVNLIALLTQLAVMPPLQRALGAGGVLLILPAVVGALAPAAFLVAALRSVLRVAEGGLKASVHRVAWEQVFAFVEPVHRSPAKLLADGTATRMGEALAALVILTGMRAGGGTATAETWASALLVVCGLAWVAATLRWRRQQADDSARAVALRVPDG
ncbi:MAG: hypothetical protein AB1635_14500 [Acidobacteriota bacterium]